MAVVMMNVLIKQNILAVTSKTDVGMSRPFTIPKNVRESAPSLVGQAVSLEVALASPVKRVLDVKGKVVKVKYQILYIHVL